jgi:UDP-N-acetylmuramate--alanine ligase
VSKYINISQKERNDFAKAIQGGVVFFVGIGGIGMSALAKYFLSKGAVVKGYDKTKTELTEQLEMQGMAIHYEESISHVEPAADLVIYTPAVPKEHVAYQYYVNNGYSVLKRSQVLGLITANTTNVCVAGTHGKTTVSTITSHILQHSGMGCNAFLGGIATNYGTNFLSSSSDIAVIEADEYDRSFLQLTPSYAIVTNMDADHLDIYGTHEAMEEAFVAFTSQIQPNGVLVAKYGLPKFAMLQADKKYAYHLTDTKADIYAKDIVVKDGGYSFAIHILDVSIDNVRLNIGGLHNIENALAAAAVAYFMGVGTDAIVSALAAYKGVKRRFEYYIPFAESDSIIMIDDYAHHPTELNALTTGVRSLFPDRELVLVFQPHLYSRTRDFEAEFAKSFEVADELVLLPIYPARELPIEGVTSEALLAKTKMEHKQVIAKEALVNWVENELKPQSANKVLVMAGAGDIDTLLNQVKNALLN